MVVFLVSLGASEVSENTSSDWELNRFNFYFEDDVYTKTDDGYSAGERLSFLYYIPNEDYSMYELLMLDFGDADSYFSMALTNQIFTPTNMSDSHLIVDDRPYAGWTYLEAGMHKSNDNHLRSLLIQVGAIGSISGSEAIQTTIHAMIGSENPKGWGNQLDNELGINLKYTHKWLIDSRSTSGFESSIAPFLETEVGNVAINAAAGATARLGWNIPKDFGVTSIDLGGDPGIPAHGKRGSVLTNDWSFSLNFLGTGSAIAKDIFLDGNTFSDSHSVEKENFVYYYGFGFTLRYKRFIFDFIEVHNSKRFKVESGGHGVGTMVVSWLF